VRDLERHQPDWNSRLIKLLAKTTGQSAVTMSGQLESALEP
jgi:hypothetical protein